MTNIPVTAEEDEAFESLAVELELRTNARGFAEAIMKMLDQLKADGDLGCGLEACDVCGPVIRKARSN